MFTGIIESIGTLVSLERHGNDARLRMASGKLDLGGVRVGDSIAVSGVCLTVTDLYGDGFCVDVSHETLSCTTFSDLKTNAHVNLEKSLTPSTPLGGHWVSGHVDGVGTVVKRYADGQSLRLNIKVPDVLARYIASKGSICMDGVSLTVNAVSGAEFEVNLIPHTLRETTLDNLAVSDQVNIEVDIIARYLERL
ncbi:MAG: riboflavin synthase, partial [Gammaproteobacteria bacterium]